MTARRLWVLVRGLPPDSLTANLAHADEQEPEQQTPQAGKVRYLEDIPVARSLREVGKFLNSGGDEFTQMTQQAG